MPIYEYECASCGHVEEVMQKFSDKPLTTCGHCSGKLHKLISQSAFHLKGRGWYVTDYAKKSAKSEAPKKDSAAKKPSSPKEKASSTDASTSD